MVCNMAGYLIGETQMVCNMAGYFRGGDTDGL